MGGRLAVAVLVALGLVCWFTAEEHSFAEGPADLKDAERIKAAYDKIVSGGKDVGESCVKYDGYVAGMGFISAEAESGPPAIKELFDRHFHKAARPHAHSYAEKMERQVAFAREMCHMKTALGCNRRKVCEACPPDDTSGECRSLQWIASGKGAKISGGGGKGFFGGAGLNLLPVDVTLLAALLLNCVFRRLL